MIRDKARCPEFRPLFACLFRAPGLACYSRTMRAHVSAVPNLDKGIRTIHT